MSQTVLITGANRGIGLAVTKVFLDKGNSVFAACRRPSEAKDLKALEKGHAGLLNLVELDVDSDASVDKAAHSVSKQAGHLDILVNMAGILPRPHDATLEQLDFDQCRQAFETNALGPVRVFRAFLPLLKHSKNPRVVNVTSGAGSISGKDNGQFYAYGTSKAALNMMTRTLAFAHKDAGITVVALDPGWVKTDMGGPNAWLTPEESSSAIVKTLEGLGMKDTGEFLYNDGKRLKW